jgi:hypothetical protein
MSTDAPTSKDLSGIRTAAHRFLKHRDNKQAKKDPRNERFFLKISKKPMFWRSIVFPKKSWWFSFF